MTTDEANTVETSSTDGTQEAAAAAAAEATQEAATQATDQDIDALLKTFETGGEDEPKPEPTQDATPPTIDPEDLAVIQEIKQEKADTAIKAAIDNSVETIVGLSETITDVYDDEVVAALLEKRCTSDDRWMNAFNNQLNNPEAWKALCGTFAKELEGKAAAKLDTTEETRGAETAARGVTHRAPQKEKVDVAKMPQHEFDEAYAERFGKGSF